MYSYSMIKNIKIEFMTLTVSNLRRPQRPEQIHCRDTPSDTAIRISEKESIRSKYEYNLSNRRSDSDLKENSKGRLIILSAA